MAATECTGGAIKLGNVNNLHLEKLEFTGPCPALVTGNVRNSTFNELSIKQFAEQVIASQPLYVSVPVTTGIDISSSNLLCCFCLVTLPSVRRRRSDPKSWLNHPTVLYQLPVRHDLANI
jgi:hypothetical protein